MFSVWSQRESHVFGDKIEEVNGILKDATFLKY